MKLPITRWNRAQRYEKSWWDARKDAIDLSYFRAYAHDLVHDLAPHMVIDASTAVLEIGSGPAGICTHLPSTDKHAVDPLEHYYATVDAFVAARDPLTHYYDARGEALPFPDARFDLVIMDNVLDHCESPETVMQELYRVLKPGGILYFRQNVYHVWGLFVRWMMERAEIDPGHPHTFTEQGLTESLRSHRLTFLAASRRGHIRTWLKELRSGNRKTIVRALLFLTRDRITLIAKK